MAQRIEVEITCDRVAPGHGGDVESLEMTLGGAAYEIDLCSKHKKPYTDLLALVITDGRRVSARRGQAGTRKQPARSSERSAEIRAWAKSQGLDVSARGRIAEEVVRKFDAE
ncbi:MAG TPA: Lsr2 family protein [Streptosporangiaceae bacterium]